MRGSNAKKDRTRQARPSPPPVRSTSSSSAASDSSQPPSPLASSPVRDAEQPSSSEASGGGTTTRRTFFFIVVLLGYLASKMYIRPYFDSASSGTESVDDFTVDVDRADVASRVVLSIDDDEDEQQRAKSPFFICDAGSTRLEWERVNDDYCDCADGSDERKTPACAGRSHAVFACPSGGEGRLMLLSTSVINDGVCDCCTGEDEPYLDCASAIALAPAHTTTSTSSSSSPLPAISPSLKCSSFHAVVEKERIKENQDSGAKGNEKEEEKEGGNEVAGEAEMKQKGKWSGVVTKSMVKDLEESRKISEREEMWKLRRKLVKLGLRRKATIDLELAQEIEHMEDATKTMSKQSGFFSSPPPQLMMMKEATEYRRFLLNSVSPPPSPSSPSSPPPSKPLFPTLPLLSSLRSECFTYTDTDKRMRGGVPQNGKEPDLFEFTICPFREAFQVNLGEYPSSTYATTSSVGEKGKRNLRGREAEKGSKQPGRHQQLPRGDRRVFSPDVAKGTSVGKWLSIIDMFPSPAFSELERVEYDAMRRQKQGGGLAARNLYFRHSFRHYPFSPSPYLTSPPLFPSSPPPSPPILNAHYNTTYVLIYAGGEKCWAGEIAGERERSLYLYLACGPSHTLLDVAEDGMCEYHALLETPLACRESDAKHVQMWKQAGEGMQQPSMSGKGEESKKGQSENEGEQEEERQQQKGRERKDRRGWKRGAKRRRGAEF
mmetsp:Transcript_29448/g.75998  ORF Transcript_29448/g.75998 Transcript_29448/m.75998 type:complete len:717 (-) Transcript_29448:126-2276(-)